MEQVFKEKHEENPNVLERVMERVDHLRKEKRARNATEMLDEKLDREEIERAMKELNDSFPSSTAVNSGNMTGALCAITAPKFSQLFHFHCFWFLFWSRLVLRSWLVLKKQ